MPGRELVPELHDVLKLTTYQHNFSDFDWELAKPCRDTATWQGIIGHHLGKKAGEQTDYDDFPSYPQTPETFLLSLADKLAACVSRRREEMKGKGGHFVVRRLWNPPTTLLSDPRLDKDTPQAEVLFKRLGSDPSWEDHLRHYRSVYETRPEDAHPGKNVTCLLTHVELTGKFFRLLSRAAAASPRPEELLGKTREEIRSLLGETARSSRMSAVRCRLRFPQDPSRVRDLNVFPMREEALSLIRSANPDSVLFRAGDEILLVSLTKEQLESALRPATAQGFHAEMIVEQATVQEWQATNRLQEMFITPVPEVKQLKSTTLYQALPTEISPPLCGICQMAPAVHRWPENPTEGSQESLCVNCKAIRDRGALLPKLGYWEEEGEARVLWLRVSLPLHALISALQTLYQEYLGSLGQDRGTAEVRFSLIAEFQNDWDNFLRHLGSALFDYFGHDSTQRILDDLFCLRVDSPRQALDALRIYHDLVNTFFPKFLSLEPSPLRFSAIVSPIKFPFFEVWRLIEDQQDEILVGQLRKEMLRAKHVWVGQVLSVSQLPLKASALHKLAEVARVSESLADLVFRGREDQDAPTYAKMREILPLAPNGLDFRSVLALAQLLEAGEERVAEGLGPASLAEGAQ